MLAAAAFLGERRMPLSLGDWRTGRPGRARASRHGHRPSPARDGTLECMDWPPRRWVALLCLGVGRWLLIVALVYRDWLGGAVAIAALTFGAASIRSWAAPRDRCSPTAGIAAEGRARLLGMDHRIGQPECSVVKQRRRRHRAAFEHQQPAEVIGVQPCRFGRHGERARAAAPE